MSSYSHAHAALAALASSVPTLSRSQIVPNNISSISGPPSNAGVGGVGPGGGGAIGTPVTNGPQSQQYCLKWNNHTNNLIKVFSELLGDENFVDVTLACDGRSIKAHKLVLAACSDYFRDVFLNNPCQHPVVIIKDVRLEDLRSIIHFMYTGEVNVSYTQMNSLLATAETLKVKGLLEVNGKQSGQNGVQNGGLGENTAAYLNSSGEDNSPQSPGLNGYFSVFNKTKHQQQQQQQQQQHQNAKRKRSFMSSTPNGNGSAFALASMFSQNGNLALAAAAAAALAQETNSLKKVSLAAALQKLTGATAVNGSTTFDDELDNVDEIGSHKRRMLVKDSSQSDDSIGNGDSHHDSNNQSSQQGDANSNEMIAMALSLAANRVVNKKAPGSVHDDDDPEDDGADESDKMMTENDADGMESDDEFYSDLKPIVSLDESPSPTNSNMDESQYANAFMATGILENSLNGLSPSNQMPNGKVCVCHLCNLTFTAYSSLRRHMSRHYADRERYECDICRKSYSRKDYLKEHKKLKHSFVPKHEMGEVDATKA